MVAAEGERELSRLSMAADGLRDSLAHARHGARVLELANGRVVRDGDVLELVVSVELDLPAEALELLGQAGLDEMNGALVDAGFRLRGPSAKDAVYATQTPLTWPPLRAHTATLVSACAAFRTKRYGT